MKIKGSILIIASILLIAMVSVIYKPLTIAIAKQQIKKAINAKSVEIGSCRWDLFHRLSFFDISVQVPDKTLFKAKVVSVEFSLASIVQGKILGFGIQDGTLKYDQVKVSNINVANNQLTAEALGGRIMGSFNLSMAKPLVYDGTFQFIDMDLTRIVKEFDLKKKVELSGTVEGELIVTGRDGALRILNGTFRSGQEGGVVTVKDTRFLQNIARSSNQPLDILVESLRRYHYNIGNVELKLIGRNLVFNASMAGETGKRNIAITLHDI